MKRIVPILNLIFICTHIHVALPVRGLDDENPAIASAHVQAEVKKRDETSPAQTTRDLKYSQEVMVPRSTLRQQTKAQPKNKAKLEAFNESFNALPRAIKKEVFKNYLKDIRMFVLKHQREFAAIFIDEISAYEKKHFPAFTILSDIAINLGKLKNNLDDLRRRLPTVLPPSNTLVSWQAGPSSCTGMRSIGLKHIKSSFTADYPLIVVHTDNTFSIHINEKHLTHLANNYSMEQLEFMVELGKKSVTLAPNGHYINDYELTDKQKKIFRSLDRAMQMRIRKQYSWIKFSEQPQPRGIDDHIEDISTAFFNTIAGWFNCGKKKLD